MFKKMVVEKGLVEEPLIRIFYKNKRTVDYGLSYLGEFLERYERAGLDPMDIMTSIAAEPGNLLEYQIYDGQFEGFADVIESELEKSDNFLNKLCYGIFLFKLGHIEKSDEVILDIIKDIDLKEEFNMLTMAIVSGNITCSNSVREVILEKLNSKTLVVDVEDIMKTITGVKKGLTYPTGAGAIRFITKAYGLKAKDFEDVERFEFFKELKNVGTKNSNYDKISSFMDISKQDFYFLCLKIAKETYAEGQTLQNAIKLFAEEIQNNIDVNSRNYVHFIKFKEELTKVDGRMFYAYSEAKDETNVIRLSKAVFDNVTQDYFAEAIEAYGIKDNKISYENICNLFYREDFIAYLGENITELKREVVRNIAIEVLSSCNNKAINDKYVEFLGDKESLIASELLVLLNRSYISIEYFMKNTLIYEKDGNIAVNYSKSKHKGELGARIGYSYYNYGEDLANTIQNKKLEIAAFKIMEYFESKSSIDFEEAHYFNRFLIAVYQNAKNYIINMEQGSEEKLKAIKVLDNFCFMYSSEKYIEFIFETASDKDFYKVLELSEESIKELANYILDSKIKINGNLRELITKLAFDEADCYVHECNEKFYVLIKNAGLSYTLSRNLESFMSCYERGNRDAKARVRENIKKSLINVKDRKFDSNALVFIKELMKNELINLTDALEVMRVYLSR